MPEPNELEAWLEMMDGTFDHSQGMATRQQIVKDFLEAEGMDSTSVGVKNWIIEHPL